MGIQVGELRSNWLFILGMSVVIALVSTISEESKAESNCGAKASRTGLSSSRNAYVSDFVQPPGQPWTYIAWVWREYPNVNSNHNLSVARSLDLVNWESTCGQNIPLPLTLENSEVIDAIPLGGGLLNNVKIGFDSKNRVVVTYQKYVQLPTGQMTTQIFNARLESDNSWHIYQVTRWTTQWLLEGGGSLPKTSYDIGFSEVKVTSSGATIQSFGRASADREGWPNSGTYVLSDDESGQMQVGMLFVDRESSDSSQFNWVPPSPKISNLATREAGFATRFAVRRLNSRFMDRWIPIRGDYDGDGINDSGIYDRYMSTFRINLGSEVQMFRFGWYDPSLLPLIGDWDGSGRATVGIYHPKSNRSFLRNVLEGGNADKVLMGYPQSGVKDTPSRWHQWSPSQRFFLRWEYLPQNRDYPYSCGGEPYLLANIQEALRLGQETVESCPEKFISDLTLWEYDRNKNQWSSSVIDQVWGGSSVSYDFLTFKNIQIVAYYNRERFLTLALRPIGGNWIIKSTDIRYQGWDSHNYITLAVDENHSIHVVGNQHSTPLNYLVSKGLDLNSLSRVSSMTGNHEQQVTYPYFFRLPDGQFAFRFRDGSSGNGETLIFKYDSIRRKWSNLSSQSLFGRN